MKLGIMHLIGYGFNGYVSFYSYPINMKMKKNKERVKVLFSSCIRLEEYAECIYLTCMKRKKCKNVRSRCDSHLVLKD
jgi:hypothetical protein